MLTLLFSGPQSQRAKLAAAFVADSFEPVVDAHGDPVRDSHGHDPDRKGHLFLTVHGDDVDCAFGVAENFGWRLRAHWITPEPVAEPSPAEKLKRLGLTPADLRSILEVQE